MTQHSPTPARRVLPILFLLLALGPMELMDARTGDRGVKSARDRIMGGTSGGPAPPRRVYGSGWRCVRQKRSPGLRFFRRVSAE